MTDIYRKSSLEKLSNPEQLDKCIKISSPMSWLALLGVLLIIAATMVWSFTGVLPSTQTVNGILVSAENTGTIFATCSGKVQQRYQKPGNIITPESNIIKIKSSDGTINTIHSDLPGKMTEMLVNNSDEVYAGSEIARFTPEVSHQNVVVCYVPLSKAGQLEKGMQVQLYPESVDTKKYGHMVAKIHSIGQYAANVDNLRFVLGADNLVADQFTGDGPVIAVICELKTDAASANGYFWSNKKGKALNIPNGTLMSAKITIEEYAPITKLFNNLKEQLEG